KSPNTCAEAIRPAAALTSTETSFPPRTLYWPCITVLSLRSSMDPSSRTGDRGGSDDGQRAQGAVDLPHEVRGGLALAGGDRVGHLLALRARLAGHPRDQVLPVAIAPHPD